MIYHDDNAWLQSCTHVCIFVLYTLLHFVQTKFNDDDDVDDDDGDMHRSTHISARQC